MRIEIRHCSRCSSSKDSFPLNQKPELGMLFEANLEYSDVASCGRILLVTFAF
jgi:hypothetical protein